MLGVVIFSVIFVCRNAKCSNTLRCLTVSCVSIDNQRVSIFIVVTLGIVILSVVLAQCH